MRSIYILLPVISTLGFTAALVPTLMSDTANMHPAALDFAPRQVHNADYGSSSPPNPNSGSAGSGSTSESAPPPPASSGSSDAPGKTKPARDLSLSFGLYSLSDDTASKPGNEGSAESWPLAFDTLPSRDVRWKRQNAGTSPNAPAQADADINGDQVHSPRSSRSSNGITGGRYKRIVVQD